MVTTVQEAPPIPEARAPGLLGAPPCRDLVLGAVAVSALRGAAAVVDPLARPLEERLHVGLAAATLLVLLGWAAYAGAMRGRVPRPRVNPDRVPSWMRPRAGIVFFLAILTTVNSALALVVLHLGSGRLLDHVISASVVVYMVLTLRTVWATATGQMRTVFPVVEPTRRLRLAVRVALVAAAVFLTATAVSVPGILVRDHKVAERNRAVAECRRLAELSLYSGMTRGSLTGQVLAQRVQDLATAARACEDAKSL